MVKEEYIPENLLQFYAHISTTFQEVYNDKLGNQMLKDLYILMKDSKRIFLIGNGGSAAICDHIANDLTKRCFRNAEVLTSYPLITCLANDFGFEEMYLRWLQIKCAGNDDDLLIAISSSGESPDITLPAEYYTNTDMTVFGISGFNGFKTNEVDKHIHFKSRNYGQIEMVTEMMLHGIIEEMVNAR